MAKDLKKVVVTTEANGYSLTVGKNGYFYFNLEALLEGFMVHVGLEEQQSLDEETIRDFITASIVWKEHGSAVKQLLEVKKENEVLVSANKNLKERIVRLNKAVRELKENGARAKVADVLPDNDADDEDDDE